MITKKNFSLKNYNSFNIDVNAKEFIEINSKEELIGLNGLLKNEKILFWEVEVISYLQKIMTEL